MSHSRGIPGVQKFGAATANPEVLYTFRSRADVLVEQTAKGTHILRGLTVFRAGVFKDSRGIERTWTVSQLAEIEANYALLVGDGTFPDVPVRENHSQSVKDVIGYFVRVYVDPADPTYLLADIEITEPGAYEKWHRGTYRSRSLEIGPYERNGEDGIYTYPTVLGLAFVDIGAVEGLHRRQDAPQHFSQFIEDGAPAPTPKEVTSMDPKALASLQAHIDAGGTAASWIAACNHAKAVDDDHANHQRQQEQAQQFSSFLAAVALHRANAEALGLPVDYTQAFTFQINGQPTQDFAAAQRHITAMETAIEAVATQERADFVKDLVKEGKILATSEASTKALVDMMPAEVFAQYRTTMDAQPKQDLLSQHGAGGPQGGGGTGNERGSDVPNEKDTLIEIVAQFKRMDKPVEFIQNTSAYKRLVVIDPTQAIS